MRKSCRVCGSRRRRINISFDQGISSLFLVVFSYEQKISRKYPENISDNFILLKKGFLIFNLEISNFRSIIISSTIDVIPMKTFIPLRTNNKFLRANTEDIFRV